MIRTETGFKTFGSLKGTAFGNEIDCERTRLNPSHLRDKLKRKRETVRVNINPHGHLFLSFIITYQNQCQKRKCATLLRMSISLALSENYCYTNLVPRVLSLSLHRAGRREPWERGCCYTKLKRCAYSCRLPLVPCRLSRKRRTNLNERVSCIYII